MPIGIGFRELQRLTSFGNGTIIKWRKLLQESNLVLKDSRGKIYLNENTNNNFEKDLVIRKYGNTSQSNVLRGKRSIRKKNKRDSFKQRRDNAYCLIATVAAMGNSSWKRTTAHGYGLVSMTDLQTGMDISFISSPLPGIGISDFYKYDKKGIQSMFDTRTFVDYNERYSYLNPSDEEAQQYIRELYENEPPVLK